MGLLDSAARAIEHLSGESVPCALVGGLAVSVRTEPRNTRDVDLAVSVANDAGAERVVRALARASYAVVAVLEHDDAGRLATVRLRSQRDRTVLVDLLFASSGIEAEIVAAAEPLELADGVTFPVARGGHLIAMKLLSRDDVTRPQDRVDLAALLGGAPPSEIERAREACRLIRERGYERGRDLEAALDEALATWRPD